MGRRPQLRLVKVRADRPAGDQRRSGPGRRRTSVGRGAGGGEQGTRSVPGGLGTAWCPLPGPLKPGFGDRRTPVEKEPVVGSRCGARGGGGGPPTRGTGSTRRIAALLGAEATSPSSSGGGSRLLRTPSEPPLSRSWARFPAGSPPQKASGSGGGGCGRLLAALDPRSISGMRRCRAPQCPAGPGAAASERNAFSLAGGRARSCHRAGEAVPQPGVS